MEALKMAKLFADEVVLRILAASFKYPKTAQELSKQLDIPVAVCYKKIKKLVSMGLIKCVDTKLSNKGKSVRCFRSQVKSAYIFFDRGRLRVRLELTQLDNRIYDQTWDILDEISKKEVDDSEDDDDEDDGEEEE